jgi:hypothetical protein
MIEKQILIPLNFNKKKIFILKAVLHGRERITN